MLMQIIDEVAAKHGLAALFHEKPFAVSFFSSHLPFHGCYLTSDVSQGVNGSGKHNNWSLSADGVNLLDPAAAEGAFGTGHVFPTVMAAVLHAVDKHGWDQCAIACLLRIC
jgi:glutamine synthetase